MQTRIYKGKDVEMLTTSATITGNAIICETFLSSKRQGWAPPYFSDLKKRIDAAFTNYLGLDSALAQRSATQAVLQIQAAALSDLSDVKVQIEADFKSDKPRRTEILKQLGYTDFYSQARKKDQEGLIRLLYRFRANLTSALTDEITAKGINTDYLDRISSYADRLSQANITQETVKGAKKIITSEAVTEFNAIYEEVISIAKIARNFYRGDPDRQELFSYTKIHKRLNAFSTAKPAET
jgi:hypothetical protein